VTSAAASNGLILCVSPTARVDDSLRIRGAGHVSIDDFAVIEEYVVVDLGSSGHGQLFIGARSKVKTGVVVRCYNGAVKIGHHTTLGDYDVIHGHGGVAIGSHVGIGPHTTIAASQHIATSPGVPIRYQGERATGIAIEDDVWIGSGCQILDGTVVGSGGVIGAGAVVTRSTPRGFICMGVPCKPVRPR
jgi:acetyltransferase-like isoleucine patch superfamily enzyme